MLTTSLNKIYNFIVECKEEGITTEQLRYAYESSSNVLREKLHDIVIILDADLFDLNRIDVSNNSAELFDPSILVLE